MDECDVETFRHYLNYWKAVLKEVNRWTDAQVEDWVASNRQLTEPNTEVLHENPALWIVRDLLPHEICEQYTAMELMWIVRNIAKYMCDLPEWREGPLRPMDYHVAGDRFRLKLVQLKSGNAEAFWHNRPKPRFDLKRLDSDCEH